MQDQLDLNQIADRALAATTARFVFLTRFDAKRGEVQMVAWAGLDSGIMQLGIKAARRIFPDFDPTRVRFRADLNALNRAVYLEGRPVSAPLQEIARGVVDHRIIAITMTVADVSQVFVVPLKVDDRVVGALSFHSRRPLTQAERYVGESLARHAAVALQHPTSAA